MMKFWGYYSQSDIPHFGSKEQNEFRQTLIDEINNKPMTLNERSAALRKVPESVRQYAANKNVMYWLDMKNREEQFWVDCRETLGYDKLLNPTGVKSLEARAWRESHHSGYSEVYDTLKDLTDFVRNIIVNSIVQSTVV